MSTSARMLRLLSLLQTHRFWTGGDLAGRLEVSERTLRRDVDRLRELGYDVDAVRGAAGGYQLRAGGALPPLLLEDEEAVAIAVGLRAAASGGVPGFEETTLQALTKVIALMPPRLRRRMGALQTQTVGLSWSGGATLDPAVLTTLAQACRDDEIVTFPYTAADGTATTRRVEPHRLVTLGRRWYLAAYDRDRQDWRSFRVDRVAGTPSTTGQRFRPRELPGGDALTYVRQGLSTQPQRHQVRVRMAAPAADVAAYMDRWGTVDDLGDGTCRMTLNTETLDWPVLIIANFDCDFTVEQPAELSALLGRLAARVSR
ncbi:YafY family protein [Nocardioides sp. WV_118_6]|uniref:helix-turn-helix transcriptional regulator n=1 Tax=Nocardioides simplex TaxID=2045 RepID=UPI00214FC4E0|nr:YafY family protein [Pimelobacter simplex]UUW89669.1 YafY family transcriptional regulator [Pimelobacter simplex]UUW93498.1 YafY family transcriptional regulator [Pimelobacter simplex]